MPSNFYLSCASGSSDEGAVIGRHKMTRTVEGVRDGASIRVVIEPDGEGIITGFPPWA